MIKIYHVNTSQYRARLTILIAVVGTAALGIKHFFFFSAQTQNCSSKNTKEMLFWPPKTAVVIY